MPAQGLYDPRHEHDACGVGFVVHIKGQKTHSIVSQALKLLVNLLHRGACGCEANTGDGAGILMQMPDRFLRQEAARIGINLPPERGYGAGLVFLPRDQTVRERVETLFEEIVIEEGQLVLGWRDVPTDDRLLGPSAVAVEPVFKQIFIGRAPGAPSPGASIEADAQFERKLYVIRKRIEHAIDAADLPIEEKRFFYVVSLSSNTLIYKGMLTADQIGGMFPDLTNPAMESALALVHQRFSTNTFPSWPLAHPYRFVAHNGEINTLRGNINWMKAREALLRSDVLGHELERILPIIREGGSDTAIFDNVLELLVMAGRSLPHAVLMMIPEPWQNHEGMSPARRAFYEYHSSLMEPWDGPASIAFTDGTVVGAVLDRNGLRPSRYYVTKDDLVVMASEVGVLDIPAENILVKERLHPGKIFLVDTAQGRIIADEEIKEQLASEFPYAEWLQEHLIAIEDVPDAPFLPPPDHQTVLRRQQAFGYTQEDVSLLLAQMAKAGEEPLGSMGTDTPLAALSERPRLLYDYFKQLFAQVTNPPLDAIREELVTSMESTIGPERNLLRPEPESCRQINVRYPIIDNDQLAKLRHIQDHPTLDGFRSVTLPMIYDPREGGAALERAMERLQAQASAAVRAGNTILILSDRGVTEKCAPIPSLLATAGVHHHLVREGTRTRCALLLESGDAREVHHVALLIGYGAGAVNPYLAFETLDDMIAQGIVEGVTREKATLNYIKALNKGILKVMSKMGISTLQSYCGAQIFEAIGLEQAFVDRYFTWTASRIGGVGIDVVASEVKQRHERAFPKRLPAVADLESGGEYRWRRDGELHLFNPETVQKLQHATRTGQYSVYRDFTKVVNDQSRALGTLRGLLDFKSDRTPGTDRRSRTCRGHPQAVRHRRHVVRLDQPGSARNHRHRHEPPRRQVEYRRRRRGSGALPPRRQRRLAPQRHQAGCLGALRRDERVPGQRRRPADQNGAGRQARRRRATPGAQGLSLDREGPVLDARRHADFTAAASRHLLDRGPGAAHSRPEERQSGRARTRQARGRGRRRHGRGRRLQGARGRGAHLGSRRRHGRVAPDFDQARRHPVGARPRRDPAGPAPQPPPRSHRRSGRRAAQNRTGRGDRRAPWRRGIRLCDRRPRRLGLHHDARLPLEHLPGGRGDAGP